MFYKGQICKSMEPVPVCPVTYLWIIQNFRNKTIFRIRLSLDNEGAVVQQYDLQMCITF